MDCSPCQPNKKITSISTITCTPVCLASSFTVSTTVNVSSYVYLSTYNSYISTTINNSYSGSNIYFSTTYTNTTYYIPSSINVNISSSAVALSTYVMNPGFNINLSSFVTLSTYVLNPGFNINISSSSAVLSTFITNNCVPVCISSPSVFSTLIINPGISTFVVNPISTFVTNPINVNISSSVVLSTFITNTCVPVCISSPSVFSTFITNSTLNVNITNTGVPISTILVNSNINIANQISDVFNRLYVNSPTAILSGTPTYTPQYEIMDYHSTTTGFVSCITISTMVILQANDGGGRAIRQTHEYQLYQAGSAHLTQFTWVPQYLGTFDNSVAVRAGLYDDYRDKNTPSGTMGSPPYTFISSIYGGTGQETNQPSMGHYFELSGNSWFVVERYNSPDNITNVRRVAQSNWNVNTFDSNTSTNTSGFILDGTVPSLLFIERQWLGAGVVRMGAYYQGAYIIAHIFNKRGYKQAYTHLSKLPIRYELEKVSGGSSDTAIMASICCSSHIGGAYTPYGRLYSLPADITYDTTRIGIDTLRPILLIRLQQPYCRATIKLKAIEMFAISNASGAFSLFLNPVLGGGTYNWSINPDPTSMIEYCYNPSGTTSTRTVSGGLCLRSGFFTGRTSETDVLSVDELLTAQAITSDIHGVPDILCVAMVSFTPNNDVTANFRWIEIV